MSDAVGVLGLDPLLVIAASRQFDREQSIVESARPLVAPGKHGVKAGLVLIGQLSVGEDYEASGSTRISAENALAHFLVLVSSSPKDLTAKLKLLSKAFAAAVEGPAAPAVMKEIEETKERVKARLQKAVGKEPRKGQVKWSGIASPL